VSIRVLEVLATLKPAGAERIAVTLACELDKARFETAMLSLYDPIPGGLEPLLAEAGVPVRHLGKRRGFDPRMFGRLLRVLREWRPHIVHTHSYVQRYTFPAALVAPVRCMVHTVHNLAQREVDRPGRLLHRLAFRLGVTPVAIAGPVRQSMREEYGLDPVLIPNGIDVSRYSRPEARQAWRAAHGFRAGDVLIASVARLEPQKNPLGLIEAFARAFAARSDVHLLLAGDGSLAAQSRSLAERLGAARTVHFLGARSDVPELLSASDLFVLASLWEGSPLAVMEAMAAGLPVAATAVGGVPELVADRQTGRLVPPGDVTALSHSLADLAVDPVARRQLGEAAAEHAMRFDARFMVASYAALFEKLVGERS